MDTGYVELAELLPLLARAESVRFRLALVSNEVEWKLHTLIIERFPKHDDQAGVAFDLNYGSVQLIGGQIRGDTAVTWLHQRVGEVSIPGRAGGVRRFTLPPFNGKVNWQRIPSHALYDYVRKPWPITRYDVTGISSTQLPQPYGFLVGDGLPFYPDLKTAILSCVYRASSVEELQNTSISPTVIVRIADPEAWLSEIKLSPTAINVTVAGQRVAGVQVTIRGSTDVQFLQQMQTNGSVECLLPRGVPSPLWIVLSRGKQWLDYYQRDERWSFTRGEQGNVTFEAGDASTEIAALIAQGEGMSTEFKENVPNERDQMLKTVAAFANGSGGVLLLGVKDDNGEPVGYAGNPDDLTQMIRNTVFPEPSVHVEVAEIEHHRIVAIYVAHGASPPYGLHETNTRYYVRRGATTFPARPEELRAIVLASQPTASGPFAGYVM